MTLDDADTDQTDAVLRVCSYHRRDFDLVVVRSRPHETRSVQASLQTAFTAAPVSGLRMLDRLPPELTSMVLKQIDLDSYFRLRHVNRRARALSTALREYRLVVNHALEGFRGLLRAGLGRGFTILDLFTSLIAPACFSCGGFGSFLFLFTAARCCFACIQSSPKLRVLPPSTLAKLTRISKSRLHRLLGYVLRTVPGIYSMNERDARRPKELVAEGRAIATLTSLGTLRESEVQALANRSEQANQRFMAATAFPWLNLNSGKAEHGRSCKGCEVRVEAMHAISDDPDRVFSTKGFLAHFESCTEAQELWAASRGGTRPVAEPEFTRRCGYFSLFGSDGLPQ